MERYFHLQRNSTWQSHTHHAKQNSLWPVWLLCSLIRPHHSIEILGLLQKANLPPEKICSQGIGGGQGHGAEMLWGLLGKTRSSQSTSTHLSKFWRVCQKTRSLCATAGAPVLTCEEHSTTSVLQPAALPGDGGTKVRRDTSQNGTTGD